MSNAVIRTASPIRRPASMVLGVLMSGGGPNTGCMWLSPGLGAPSGGQSGFTTMNSTWARRPVFRPLSGRLAGLERGAERCNGRRTESQPGRWARCRGW